jgi:hypothetical protein
MTSLCAIHRILLTFTLQLVVSSKMHKLRIRKFGAELAYCHAKLAGQMKLKKEPTVLL